MIDVSKLPAGPWHDARYVSQTVIKCGDGGNIIATLNDFEAFTAPEVAAVASLLIWARSIVEPPQEVKEAMRRIRMANAAIYLCEVYGDPNYSVCHAKYTNDRFQVANWTLKIFSEVQSCMSETTPVADIQIPEWLLARSHRTTFRCFR